MCAVCACLVDEAERREMLEVPRLAPAQEGAVSFSTKWPWVATSPRMVPMRKVGVEEWERLNGGGEEEERFLCQFRWSIPFVDDQAEVHGAEIATLLGRGWGGPPRGEPSEDAAIVTVGVDVHLRHLEWIALAWDMAASALLCTWGTYLVEYEGEPTPANVRAALDGLALEFEGWDRPPDLCVADAGWEEKVVMAFTKEHDGWLPSKGFDRRKKAWREPTRPKGTQRGDGWRLARVQRGRLFEIDVDRWKDRVALGLQMGRGLPGAIAYPDADDAALRALSLQLTAEVRGPDGRWRPKKGQKNHWLDALVLARVAADRLGVRPVAVEVGDAEEAVDVG